MQAIGRVASVLDRVATIESQLAPSPDRQQIATIESSVEFDPFGETYQRAVEAASAPPPAASSAAMSPYGAAASFGVAAHVHGGRPAGGYGSMPVPGELAAYGNGRVPAERLTPIGQPGHRLFAPAAQSWNQLVEAAAADGFDLRITDSYRSYDQQVDLVNRKGLYSEGGLGATPGTSNHGWGLAVDADVTDPAMLQWLRTNGPRYGWVEAVPREPWHWEYRPHQT